MINLQCTFYYLRNDNIQNLGQSKTIDIVFLENEKERKYDLSQYFFKGKFIFTSVISKNKNKNKEKIFKFFIHIYNYGISYRKFPISLIV